MGNNEMISLLNQLRFLSHDPNFINSGFLWTIYSGKDEQMKKALSILTICSLDKHLLSFFSQAWHSLGKRGFELYKNANVTSSGTKQGKVSEDSKVQQSFVQALCLIVIF